MDLQLPREVRPVWLEGVMTSQFELDTLPLLFSQEGLYAEYYEALIRKNSHINGQLAELKKFNDEARSNRDQGLWQECIQLLWKCLELRKILFEGKDLQVMAAQKHYIMTLVNFATFFLKEGGSGHSAADEAMYYRSFGVFKQAEDATNMIEDRVDRMFLKAVVANNFATYYARRKKQKAAAQKISIAVKAFKAFSQEMEKKQERAEVSKTDQSSSSSAKPKPKRTGGSIKSQTLAYETDSEEDEEADAGENSPAANSSELTPEQLKSKIENLYFALQNGSGDVWSNRFAEGLERLLLVVSDAEAIVKAVLVEEEVTESDNEDGQSPPSSSSSSEQEEPTESDRSSASSSSRSSSAGSHGSDTPKKPKKEKKEKKPKPAKVKKEKAPKEKKDNVKPKTKKVVFVRRSPVQKENQEEGGGAAGHCIKVLGNSDLPIDIATILSLYHNTAVAYVGVRNYKSALQWNTRGMEVASAYLHAKPPPGGKAGQQGDESGGGGAAGGLSINTALVQRMRKCREYLEQMNFMTTTSSRAVAKLKASTQPLSHQRPGSAKVGSTSVSPQRRRNSAADRAKDREEGKTLKVAELALAHPKSAEAAAAYLPQHSNRFKEPTMAEKLRTYLVGMSYRDLVQNYEVDDGGKLAKMQKAQQKSKRQIAREKKDKEEEEIRERRERLKMRREKEAQKTQDKHEAAVAAHTPRLTTPRRKSPRRQADDSPRDPDTKQTPSSSPKPSPRTDKDDAGANTGAAVASAAPEKASDTVAPTASSSSAQSAVDTLRSTTEAPTSTTAPTETPATKEDDTPKPETETPTKTADKPQGDTTIKEDEDKPTPEAEAAPTTVSRPPAAEVEDTKDTNNNTAASGFSPLATANGEEKPLSPTKSDKNDENNYDDDEFSKSSRSSSPSSRAASSPQTTPRAPVVAEKKGEDAYGNDDFEDTQDSSMIQKDASTKSEAAADATAKVDSDLPNAVSKPTADFSAKPDTYRDDDFEDSSVSKKDDASVSDKVKEKAAPREEVYGDDDFEDSTISKKEEKSEVVVPESPRGDAAVASSNKEDAYKDDDFEDSTVIKEEAPAVAPKVEEKAAPEEDDGYGDDDFEDSTISKREDVTEKPSKPVDLTVVEETKEDGGDAYEDDDFEL